MTATQIASITATNTRALADTQVAAFSTTQVAALTTTQIAGLNETDMGEFAATQIAAMTTSQVAAISATNLAAFAETQVAALTATQLRQVEFEYETLELQRQFAQRAAEAPAGAVAPQSADTAALMQRGHDALRIHDHDAAQAAYLQAFRADGQSTAAGRSLASIVLVQLALRERRARNTDGQRQALRAFLALNPANIWVQDQLSALDRQP